MNKIKYPGLALFLLLQIYLLFVHPFPVLDYAHYQNDFPQPFLVNNKPQTISQTFRTPGPLSHIDIFMANYLKKPTAGTLQLSITKDDKLLFLQNYPANTTEDNQFYRFDIKKKKIPTGEYTLHLKYLNNKRNEPLAVWIHQKDIYPHGNLLVNGTPRPGDMTFRVFYRSTIWNQRAHIFAKIPTPWFSHAWLNLGLILLLLGLNFLVFYAINKILSLKIDKG